MIKHLFGPVALFWMLTVHQASAQRLDLFTSHGAEKVPYSNTCGFYDFLPENNLADTVIDGQRHYYVFFELPFELTEIGVRMISPVPSYVFPHIGDRVTADFESNKKSTTYFNPSIALEKRITKDSLGNELPYPKWESLAQNNDSEEVISQPSGKNSNSQLRVYFEPYTAGIYRIVFKSMSKGTPVGSYLLQFGTEPGVKRLKMSRTIAGLAAEE